MMTLVRLEVDGQAEPVDQQSFADEKNICAVMRLMAPMLLRFGILVEFTNSGTRRSLSLTAVTPALSKIDHVH